MSIFPLHPLYELAMACFLEADYQLRLRGPDTEHSRERYAFLDMDYDPFDQWIGDIIIASGGNPIPEWEGRSQWVIDESEGDYYNYENRHNC